VLKESGVKDIFGAFESKESQMKRDTSRKSIGKKAQKHFMDELAPSQIEMGRTSNPKTDDDQ